MKPPDPHWQKLVHWARMNSSRPIEMDMPVGFAHKIVHGWMAQQRPSLEDVGKKCA